MSKRLAVSVYLVSILFFSCFFILPIWEILRGGFFDCDHGFTLDYLKTIFQNPVYVEGIINSFIMGLGSTALGLCIAIPLAYVFNGYDFIGKRFFSSLVLLPIMLPPFVGANGVLQLLGTYGTLNTILINLGWMDVHQPFDWLGAYPMMRTLATTAAAESGEQPTRMMSG